MKNGMSYDELKRLESLERLVHRQTDKIMEMREEIATLKQRLQLKGRAKFPEPPADPPVPALPQN